MISRRMNFDEATRREIGLKEFRKDALKKNI